MTRTIISVGWVKNEADVIESSVRYALTHSDKVILDEDSSVDNTREILQNLQREFGDRIILPEKNERIIQLLQDEATNALIRAAFEQYGADIVIPFDADEFVISPEGKNVREILLQLPEECCFVCTWRTYLWYAVNEPLTDFVPFNYRYFQNPQTVQEMTKVIIQKKAWKKYHLSICMGNHDVKCLSPEYTSVPLPNLVFAHYPVRSKNQIATKAVRDGPGKASVDLRCMHGTGWHILQIYRNLRKQNFQIRDEEMLGICLIYSGYTKKFCPGKLNREIAVETDPTTLYPAIHCIYPPTPFDLFDTVVSTFVTLSARYRMENPVFCMRTLLAANETIGQDYRYQTLSNNAKGRTNPV